MTIIFRIATAADDGHIPAAEIGARDLAEFRAFLRQEGTRIGKRLLSPDEPEDELLSYTFEARVCPLSLSAMARVFDYNASVIRVLEEAQFRNRRVAVWRCKSDGSIRMRVSLNSDAGVEINLADGSAYALLQSLGLRPDGVGELPAHEVRRRLDNPAVRRRMDEEDVSQFIAPLERLLATADLDDSSRFEWV